MISVKNLNSSIYYSGQYWNDIPLIANYISKNISGDDNINWIEYFKNKYPINAFKHALFINCGDGRWEREFIDSGVVKKVTAFDISPELISKANKQKGTRKITYFIADANKVTLPENTYDLVVNMAALHHVQYLNRLCLLIAKSLKDNGIFISYDFVGPGRNQYPFLNYFLMKLMNRLLPKNMRKPHLGYPHLPTMLATDPTEAIHADLITKTIDQYFNVLERHDIGGGIAYEIFTHNSNFYNGVNTSSRINSSIKRVLVIDKYLTKLGIIPTFFSFIVSKPNKHAFKNKEQTKYFQKQENIREKHSQTLYNTYSFKNFIMMLIYSRSWRKRIAMIVKYLKVKLKLLI